jgi:hypothetical protein
MADWVNKGSYADLSGALKPDPVSVLVPTSQHAGDQIFENNAMTAPGGASGDLGWNVGAPVVSKAPVVETQQSVQPGEDGKPQAKGENWTPPGAPSWKPTTVPEVVREK